MVKRIVLTFLVWINLFFVFPCGWDSDTIEMEKQMFPTVHELITGKFLQHSKEFYYWRIKDREEKIKLYPDSLDLYDDLAWAYNKIDEPQKGVEVMLDKEKIQPGLYKTYANLGTCYIHSKQYDIGLEYIKKAIEINPEAHFGREVYQQYLVEYVLKKQDSTGNFTIPLGKESNNFYHYLKERHFAAAIKKGSTEKKEISKAVKGIAGMMKFSNHNSPVLLEALGDLLTNAESGVDFGAGHLASRAYLKASFLSRNEKAIKEYKKKANVARERTFSGIPSFIREDKDGNTIWEGREEPMFASHVIKPEDLEKVLKLEIQSANLWVEEIRQNELLWIKQGEDPDSAFSANYYEEPSSKAISQYNARKKQGEIEEEYWLNLQLENPKEINSFLPLSQLPDSTKNWLDSIYQIEFSVLPEEEEVKEDTVSTKPVSDVTTGGEEAKGKSLITYFAAGIIILLVVLLARRNSKKTK